MADRTKVRSFSCLDHYLCLAFAQLTYRESLRDIESCLRAQAGKLYHMGIKSRVSRSTLADANEEPRLAHLRRFCPVAHCHRPSSLCRGIVWRRSQRHGLRSGCQSASTCACRYLLGRRFVSTKAAIKLHTLLDLRGNIPSFLHISDGKLHDVNVLDLLLPEPVLSTSWTEDTSTSNDFIGCTRRKASLYFIRAKSNLKAQRRYSHPVDRSTGLICDQTVVLTGFYSRQDFDTPLRRVRFKDPDTGKRLVFLTNNFILPAFTITELYRCRWQVELFFKWIKQHLRIKVFFGTSENAVKTQIWIAVSAYVLVAIVKKRLNLSASLYEMLQDLEPDHVRANPLRSTA